MAEKFAVVLHVYVYLIMIIPTKGVSLGSVELTSTLSDGNITYNGREVIFICTILSQEDFLTWRSDHYIDQVLQISSLDDPGHQESSPQNPNTVATLVNATANGGVIVIVSRLRIIASNRNSSCSVTCQIGNNGPVDTIQFQTVTELSTTALESTTSRLTTPGIGDGYITPTATDSGNETDSTSSVIAAGVIAAGVIAAGVIAAIVGGGIVIFVVVVVVVIVTKRPGSTNSSGSELEMELKHSKLNQDEEEKGSDPGTIGQEYDKEENLTWSR